MGILHKNACSMRWTHLEPRGIPEDRGELLHHLFAIANLTCSANEHVATFIQGFDGFFIQKICYVNILWIRSLLFILNRCGSRRWIYPEGPTVSSFCPRDRYDKHHLGRFLDIRKRYRYLAQFKISANRQITSWQHTFCIYLFGGDR